MRSEKEVRDCYKVKKGDIVLKKKKTYEVVITFCHLYFCHLYHDAILIKYKRNKGGTRIHFMYYRDNFSKDDISRVANSIKREDDNFRKILSGKFY